MLRKYIVRLLFFIRHYLTGLTTLSGLLFMALLFNGLTTSGGLRIKLIF